jgi:hypothetical protein
MEAILYFSSKYFYLQSFTIWGFTTYLNIILSKYYCFSNISLILRFNLKTRKLLFGITLIVMGTILYLLTNVFIFKPHQIALNWFVKHLGTITKGLQN